MDIDDLGLRRLRAFQLVARHGTIRFAAARLNVTSPAVSIQISRLEADLGVILFERLPNKMMLTAAGTRFLRAVDGMIEQAETALLELGSGQMTGRLSVSIGSDNSAVFAPIISNYVAQNRASN